jgi:hypothetical protein
MLRWKNKIFWKEDDDKWYINPLIGVPIILAVAGIAAWMIVIARGSLS